MTINPKTPQDLVDQFESIMAPIPVDTIRKLGLYLKAPHDKAVADFASDPYADQAMGRLGDLVVYMVDNFTLSWTHITEPKKEPE